MRKTHVRLPSPAMLVALVALFVALGGTSYAALTLGKNSVGSKQLKKNAVTTSKIKNRAVTGQKLNLHGVTAPNASELGGVGASGYEGRAMWALVEYNGAILAQSGGITVQDHPFAGAYYLAFPGQVAGKAVIATPSSWDETFGELAEASPCGSTSDAVDCVHGSNTSSDAFVSTADSETENPENVTFYITVLP